MFCHIGRGPAEPARVPLFFGKKDAFSVENGRKETKKPDASPYARMKVRPRTCSDDDRETPSKTRRHNLPVLVFRTSEQKSFLNLVGFHTLLLKIPMK